MTQTHIHLIITHLPIFGSLLGGLVARTGYLGGQIRHTEIANTTTISIDKDHDN